MKNFLILLLFGTLSHFIFAQGRSIDINDFSSVHSFQLNSNSLENRFAVPNKFTARGLNGKRKLTPSYHYFYEFPDGNYYISDNSYINRVSQSGEFGTFYDNSSVVFKTTQIYDDDDDDDAELRIGDNLNGITFPINSASARNSDNLELKISHNNNSIILNEEYVIIVDLPSSYEGQDILLVYNENAKQIFTTNGLIPPRPSSSDSRKATAIQRIMRQDNFSDYFYFEGERIGNPNRNIFVNLKTKNTFQFAADDIFTIRAYQIVDGERFSEPADLQLRFLGNAARAHDPNDILVDPTCIDKKSISQKLDYRVRFQNIGGAQAKNVLIDVKVSDAIDMNAIDNNSFSVSTFNEPNLRLPAPNYSFNIDEISRKISFILNGINLDGLEQVGRSQEKRTKGSVKFTLPLKSNYSKKPIKCIATILFEDGLENDSSCIHMCDTDGTYPALEKITTEPAITEFKKFHSLKPNKIKAGFDYVLIDNTPGIFAGISAAPSACNSGIYNQFELIFTYSRYVCNNGIIDTATCVTYVANNKTNSEIIEWEVESSTFGLGIVPLHLKYDLSNTLSLGVGVELRGNYKTGKFYQLTHGTVQRNDLLFDASIFADANFGNSAALNYGLRYLYGYRYDFSENAIKNQFTNQSRAQLYVQRTF